MASALRPRSSGDRASVSQTSGGPLRVGNFRRDWFDKAARSIGLPGLTPHELRHTAATLAIESGATIKDIQAMLGHKDATLTLNRYGHHTDAGPARVAESMSRAAEQAREKRRGARLHAL